ncbi:hypothetical protein [Pseudomonas sp. CGJS7]|uniref:hypothetical protein n=1 Tax=Pseudomonas sp. CGJS7 TaxID=3109348 RepID=UPI00300AB199
MDFATLKAGRPWTGIVGCPGRYVLKNAKSELTLAELLGGPVPVSEHRSPLARDVVLVARLADGGVISYRRPDGGCLHTLNTAEGMARKLAQLGIASA